MKRPVTIDLVELIDSYEAHEEAGGTLRWLYCRLCHQVQYSRARDYGDILTSAVKHLQECHAATAGP